MDTRQWILSRLVIVFRGESAYTGLVSGDSEVLTLTVIGITGPTGAGKTTALHCLERLGAVIIDCDAVYHQLLESDSALQKELCERFGSVLDEQDGVDRKKLGGVVFGDPAALADLDAIVRSYICRAVNSRLAAAERAGAVAAAVDGITIIESGLAAQCDTTVAVLAPVEDRVRRICLREGISEEYARARVAAQKDDNFFRSNCEHILFNDCPDLGLFEQRATDLFQKLIG